MIKVYFETEGAWYAELVAYFNTEETYRACVPALKKLARGANMILTESVTTDWIEDLKITKND